MTSVSPTVLTCLQAASLHDAARLIKMLGDVQLVRVALALHLDDVRRLGILPSADEAHGCGGVSNTAARGADLGLEESDGLGDVEDPLLVERKHLRGTRRRRRGWGGRNSG